MSTVRVQNSFISDGTALPAGGLAITTANIGVGKIAIGRDDSTTLTPGQTISDSGSIVAYQALANGNLKHSMQIPGRKITQYKGISYTAPTRDVFAIGYNRFTATGSIVANNDSDYDFYLVFHNDKRIFSERALRVTFTIHSDPLAATELTIARQIADTINGNAVANKQVTAIIVGNGTGAPTVTIGNATRVVYGGTGATHYGVEITSNILVQNVTDYSEERVYFDVLINDLVGFGATSKGIIQAMSYGVGSYRSVYDMENFNFGYEGVVNRTKWPIPALAYTSVSTGQATTIVPTATGTTGQDIVTFSASVAGMLSAGDLIVISGNSYEIKYFQSTTVATLCTPLLTSPSGTAVTKTKFYSFIVLEFSNPSFSSGSGVYMDNIQSVAFAIPSGIAGSAYNVPSVAASDLMARLNPYMASLGFPNVTII